MQLINVEWTRVDWKRLTLSIVIYLPTYLGRTYLVYSYVIMNEQSNID